MDTNEKDMNSKYFHLIRPITKICLCCRLFFEFAFPISAIFLIHNKYVVVFIWWVFIGWAILSVQLNKMLIAQNQALRKEWIEKFNKIINLLPKKDIDKPEVK